MIQYHALNTIEHAECLQAYVYSQSQESLWRWHMHQDGALSTRTLVQLFPHMYICRH
jgi:hypothetical protein